MSPRLPSVCACLLLLAACNARRTGTQARDEEGSQRGIDVARREVARNDQQAPQGASVQRPPVETSNETDTPSAAQPAADGELSDARARFAAAPGLQLTGQAQLSEVAGGVQIDLELQGAPAGPKAVHIHELGDCSDMAGGSTGKDFAPVPPTGRGASAGRDSGAVGDITVGADGQAKGTIRVPAANLHPGQVRSFLGRSLLVYEGPGRGPGSPRGLGRPIACATIGPS
jgi:Cu-Zn family superoxide dismutase